MAAPPQGQADSSCVIAPTRDNTERDSEREEELALAIAAKGGCIDSFEQLVTRLEGRLFAFLFRKTGNHHLAQDLLQSTFVTAYRKLHRYNPKYAFTTWIYTIASRLAINHFRRRQPVEAENADWAVDENPRSNLMASEKARGIWGQARKSLPESQFNALWHFYGEERNLAETADVMNKSVGSVKVLLHRARRKLAEELPTGTGF
ncbi:MAG: sigma-70 family RNA polymerase sigma factor [Verrucomicrobiota bacterium]|nr:sigma-70 family RNA polymerase sigma factor [Verrucomicrobiota bacterium]MDP7048172.1 sigma-70 family RNA polymerase sigma factor [Verrucomicrobiota bacterium]